MQDKRLRRTQAGVVLQVKNEKTCVVQITSRYKHPVGKYVTKINKFVVHDENSVAKANDKVIIAETTPKSKLKRWEVLKIIAEDS